MAAVADRQKSTASAARTRRTQAKRSAKSRAAATGATRRVAPAAGESRAPSIWLNRLLILLGAGVVLAAAAQAYVTLDALPVQRISVSGQLEHTQAEAVQEMVQTNLAGGFLSADLQRMRTELEGLPWIFEATIRRRWPNALEIHVVEQLPIARWGQDSFLNHEGGIFRSDKDIDWQSLPALNGPRGTAPALMAKYLRLLEILAPLQLRVSALSEDERGQLQVVLGNGMQLALGGSEFRTRMQRFVAIYRRELVHRANQVERVDLRYRTGLAVAFKETEPVVEQDPSQVAGI